MDTINLLEIYKKFPTKQDCLVYLEQIRWSNRPVCPYCKSNSITKMKNENRYHCNTCNTSFSVTIRTLFQKTRIDLQKWFYAIYLILNNINKKSIRSLSNEIQVNKDTAWYINFRIKKALNEKDEFIRTLNDTIVNQF